MKTSPATLALSFSLALLTACAKTESPTEPVASAAPGAGIATTVTDVDPATLPPDLLAVVNATVPGMQVDEVEKKEREGRTYFDIEGNRPDGSEVELDVLEEGAGYRVVEIQRDIPWSDAPAVARDAAVAGGLGFEPVRVIESTQTDGSVIYELFADGKPDKPSKEVRVTAGKAEVLEEEWQH
jgi:hypothetical protein